MAPEARARRWERETAVGETTMGGWRPGAMPAVSAGRGLWLRGSRSPGTAPGALTAGAFCARSRRQLQKATKDGPWPAVLPEGRMHGPPGEGGHVPARPTSSGTTHFDVGRSGPCRTRQNHEGPPGVHRPYCTIANGRVSGNRSPMTRTKSGDAHEVVTARPSNITAGAAGPQTRICCEDRPGG